MLDNNQWSFRALHSRTKGFYRPVLRTVEQSEDVCFVIQPVSPVLHVTFTDEEYWKSPDLLLWTDQHLVHHQRVPVHERDPTPGGLQTERKTRSEVVKPAESLKT